MTRRRKPQQPQPEPVAVALAPIVRAVWQAMTTGTGRAIRTITPLAQGADREQRQPHDSLGTVLLLTGLLLGAAMFTHPPNPAGAALHVIAALGTASIGILAYAAPVALIWLGVQVLRLPAGLRTPTLIRHTGASVLAACSIAGIAQLSAGAGGLLGQLTGTAPASLLTAWVMLPVLILATIAALITVTGFTAPRLPRRSSTQIDDGLDEDDLDDLDVGDEFAASTSTAPAPAAVRPVTSSAPLAGPAQPVPTPVPAAAGTSSAPARPVPAAGAPGQAVPAVAGRWQLPPLSLLAAGDLPKKRSTASDEVTVKLQNVLDQFSVKARVSGYRRGPAVTRYEISLGAGVKVEKVEGLQKNFALALGTANVRMLSPIPGKSAVGVEVPNKDPDTVTLGDVIAAYAAWSSRTSHRLLVGLGKDVDGHPIAQVLAKMPHLLIAGATGSGKSVQLNTLLISILTRATPDEVRLLLIDPKRVELAAYAGLPHLLRPIVTHASKAVDALQWLVTEMEQRYDQLAAAGVRNIDEFNHRARAAGEKHLPYLLAVVDELADLMMVAKAATKTAKANGDDDGEPGVEDLIVRILQLARAAGIHLVLATQRPSVDVVTGLIKANLPVRLAFAVSSLADSRVILDTGGAEKLLGRGDALFTPAGSSTPIRLQGACVSDTEIAAVVAFWRRQQPTTASATTSGTTNAVAAAPAQAVPVPAPQLEAPSPTAGPGPALVDPGADSDVFLRAVELVVSSQFGSTSMLQRKQRIGFAKAGRVMDLLEQAGVVGPSEGSKAREVLIKPEQLPDLLTRLATPGTDGADDRSATVLTFPQHRL